MTKEEIEKALFAFIEVNGRCPTRREMGTNAGNGLPSASTVRRVYGSFGKLYLEVKILHYSKAPKLCAHCGKELPYKKRMNKFCDHSCSANFNNPLKQPKEIDNRVPEFVRTKSGHCTVAYVVRGKTREKGFCLNCQKPLRHRYKSAYCCIKCAAEHRIAIKENHWLFVDSNVSSKFAKACLLRWCGDKPFCSVCKNDTWNGKPIALELEHIDGDSTNNRVDNLCLLCPNCHAQTPTYKAKNKGRGRFSRAQRYRDGKSY